MRVKIREAMEEYRRRTGERMTYKILASRTGLSRATVESLATRVSYNTTLATVEKLCRVLGCEPGDMLEMTTDETKGEPHED